MTSLPDLCMNCLKPLPAGAREEDPCPFCGDLASKPNPANCLQVGTLLSERYLVGRLQRQGGDAAIYAGYDTVDKSPITIREFFPDTLCTRGEDDRLLPGTGGEQTYEEYLNKFLVHARKVARMRDLPASIPTYDIFRENDTAYTVSERCPGQTLAAFLEERGKPLTWEEARPLFVPLASSLISLHKAGVYHLGLAPDTLILGEDGKLHIDGFAIPEARQAGGELTPLLASGYAAPEQYESGLPCGPATDVYGLGAVIFRTLVGVTPPDGETRSKSNADLTVPAEVAEDLPPHVAAALFGALQPVADKRIGSLAALRDRLVAAPAVAELLNEEETAPGGAVPVAEEEPEEEEEEESRRGHRGLWITLALIAFFLLVAFGAWFLLDKLFPNRIWPHNTTPTSVTTLPTGEIVETPTTTQFQPDRMATVPNLVGQKFLDLRGHIDWSVQMEGLKYDDAAPMGVVVSQRPAAGEQADFTQPIYVIVGAGPRMVTLPDFTGWRREQAERYLLDMGFTVAVDELPVSNQDAGCVDSTLPPRGTAVERGTEVRLRVSTRVTTVPVTEPTTPPTSAPVYVAVPDLTGWSREHAELLLQALGFEVTVQTLPESEQEAGMVDGTLPGRDSRLLKGSQVVLQVSARPETPPSETGGDSTTPTDPAGPGPDAP